MSWLVSVERYRHCSEADSVQKESVWMMSTVTAGSAGYIQAVIDNLSLLLPLQLSLEFWQCCQGCVWHFSATDQPPSTCHWALLGHQYGGLWTAFDIEVWCYLKRCFLRFAAECLKYLWNEWCCCHVCNFVLTITALENGTLDCV